MSVLDQKSDWLVIYPIYNLIIEALPRKELQVGRVTFIDREKLRRKKKVFGVSGSLSRYDFNLKGYPSLLEKADTYALVNFKGIPTRERQKCRNIIEDAVNIISSSQSFYRERTHNCQFGIIDESRFIDSLIINKNTLTFSRSSYTEHKVFPFRLNSNWKEFQKKCGFFFNLIKLVNRTNKNSKWSSSIKKAAILLGKSMQSRNLEECFMLNMIIIEILLTKNNEKYSEKIPERVESFLGWNEDFEKYNYRSKIEDIYRRRCEIVHEGFSEKLSIDDLLFSDDLVFNIMCNIINHPKVFTDKQSVISFSDKVKAEKLLKIKSKSIPGTMTFVRKTRSNKIERI